MVVKVPVSDFIRTLQPTRAMRERLARWVVGQPVRIGLVRVGHVSEAKLGTRYLELTIEGRDASRERLPLSPGTRTPRGSTRS